MPHVARKLSESGYYHVVPKGAGERILFSDDEDRELYVDLLAVARCDFGLLIHAYCLMSNHVHMVLEDRRGLLGESMKYVHERYAQHYAEKVGQRGSVFRRPYWSEPIEDDARLLCAVRYVHANPAVAGICMASAYQWSSVKDYLGRSGITDTGMVLGMLGGRAGFIDFSKASRSTAYPFEGSKLRLHMSDDEMLRLATHILGHDPRAKSTIEEAQLLKSRGFAAAQVERLTGFSRRSIRTA